MDTHEGKSDERCERRFLWEGQSLSGSPVDERPWGNNFKKFPELTAPNCHEVSYVMKCQMSRSVECHEVSNVLKCQRSNNNF